MNDDLTSYGHQFATGDLIFREGDVGECAYIIHRGEVAVFVERDGERVPLATLSTGQIVGEMALVDEGARTASAIAVNDVVATAITVDHIQNRLRSADPLINTVLKVILARYRDSLKYVRQGEFENVTRSASDAPVDSKAVQFSDGLHEKILEQLRLEHDLSEQLNAGGLELLLQPIVSIAEDRVVGYEALSRWEHPELGQVRPDQFVRIAEETGLIHHLGTWLIDEAIKLHTVLEEQDFPAGFLSINVSPRQFDRPEMIELLEESAPLLCGSGRKTRLEVTESVLMGRPDEAMQTIIKLRDWGYRIALDDFGTGYSSLGYLHRFPIDAIKIDRSFIVGMLDDRSKMVLVRSITRLANEMHLDLIAEGVENEAQAETLKGLGCRYLQGYLYTPPLPAREALAFARNMNIGS